MISIRKPLKLYSTLVPIVLLSACATDMMVPVIVPAGVDIRMERLSVYPVKDSKTRQDNSVATRELESLFVNAEINGESVFDVLAISELGTIQDQKIIEMQAYRGSFDQSTVSALQAKGVQGLVITYLDEVASNENSRVEVDGKKISCTTRKFDSVFHPKIVNTADARIVVQRSYSGNASRTACGNDTLDSNINIELAKEARVEALKEMRKDIAPYTRNLKATVLTNFCGGGGSGRLDALVGKALKGSRCDDSQPPADVIKLVKNGAVNVEGGRLDKACHQWNEAASMHSKGFVVPYLLGLCAEVGQNNLIEARSFYRQADDQTPVPIAAISEAMKRLDMKATEKTINARKRTPIPARRPNLEILAAQKALAGAGYDPGPADGFMGDKTSKALNFFQEDYGLDVTGMVDLDTKRALDI